MSRYLLSSSPAGGAGMVPAGAGPGAQGAHHWGSPAPDLQWPGPYSPAVIQRVTVGLAQIRPCRGAATEAYRQENQCQWRTGKSTKKRISAAHDEGTGPRTCSTFGIRSRSSTVLKALVSTLARHDLYGPLCGPPTTGHQVNSGQHPTHPR